MGKKFLVTALLFSAALASSAFASQNPLSFDGSLYVQAGKVSDSFSSFGYTFDANLEKKLSDVATLHLRAHTGQGQGADAYSSRFYANLNTLADDNPSPDAHLQILEAYLALEPYRNLTVYIGKTEPLVFIDQNEYANDELSQFLGKPFVNNPAIDYDDAYNPLLAAELKLNSLKFTALLQSHSYNWKFSGSSAPVVAFQTSFSPKNANVRVYFWKDNSLNDGWCAGLSLDGRLGSFGVFSRASVSGKGFPQRWFASVGAVKEFKELTFGLGFADVYKELHFESYVRKALSDNVGLSADAQFIPNPSGKYGQNDYVLTLRSDFAF